MDKKKICIIGLGYVGLPLAVAFSKKLDSNIEKGNKNSGDLNAVWVCGEEKIEQQGV